ncbi:MAG: tRNA (adenosine(37)-N6)-threonylcarbamoyltransferase complex transferase subunit TsaD [Phycisphaeraceae bacterium]|nr:tRNA (adenosine(37)-N6)-threonylcarbamoyltransferase complex transferase subunit TsaD [Phycisphaeraceae bacterium]
MLILGLETSCDETACAVVEDGRRVRSSIVASQHDLHEKYAGVVPEIASRAHVERLSPVVAEALRAAGCGFEDLGAIAVGHRPGLIGSLLVGVAAAKALAWSVQVPLIGVDHVQAHLYAGLLDSDADPDRVFPALGLVVSGGHSSLYAMDSAIDMTRLGATIDDAVGEAYDKAATILGLGYPGGPALDALARTGDPTRFRLPISRLEPGSLNFSFSGLKTALLYQVRGTPGPGGAFARDSSDLSDADRRDFAAAFQHAAVESLMLKLQRALTRLREAAPVASLLVGGGVSANSLLRSRLGEFARHERLGLFLPPMAYCVDNAAMIAGLGSALFDAGRTADLHLAAVPTTAC